MYTLHLRKLILFKALSLADLVLTWHLLQHGKGNVYESNPIANAWLSWYGWIGLVIFKLVAVFFVACLCVVISFYRPRAGGRVLIFACSILAMVILYSCSLLGFTQAH